MCWGTGGALKKEKKVSIAVTHSSGRGRSEESQRALGRIGVKGREKPGGPGVTASRPTTRPPGPPLCGRRPAAGPVPGLQRGCWSAVPWPSAEADPTGQLRSGPSCARGRDHREFATHPAGLRTVSVSVGSHVGSHLQRTYLHFSEPFRGLQTLFQKETYGRLGISKVRQRERERHRELETSMSEKHQSAASCTPRTGDVPATKVHALDRNEPGTLQSAG
ncbi:hypothetical protein MDA_GLEAN10014423 [Myotis davidii]|uniref:Uncharacterized protein n=1 Tax=Myotis davidii TaxID=225400 RepID=L5LX26_MYODS|nr:hypothetical protein MDA_GLEAN10014423 [Myotis davidii]